MASFKVSHVEARHRLLQRKVLLDVAARYCIVRHVAFEMIAQYDDLGE